MVIRKYRTFVGDFETTVYKGQTSTEVWRSGLCELNTENAQIFHSIDETMQYLIDTKSNCKVYYHNLKFDGEFWVNWLYKNGYRLAITEDGFVDIDDMPNNSFQTLISMMGQWYSITIKVKGKYIVLQDSLKLLPFSVKQLGKAFQTKHQKLDMEYTGYRYSGCEITEQEQEYLKNDLYVVKERLEVMFNQGHKSMTIGSCCLKEFKDGYADNNGVRQKTYKYYDTLFPRLENIELNKEFYGSSNADEYIRKSYKGGWCYVVKGKENTPKYNGTTADVNSLYPSVMSGESGNAYPVGEPKFCVHRGLDPITELPSDYYYFVRIKTRFYIKDGYLPFIQIKDNWLYKRNENLTTSDYIDEEGNAHKYIINADDELEATRVELTLTKTDYELFLKHYDVEDFEVLDFCYFDNTMVGLFDRYINKYKKIKQESKGAMRTLAKLFLNNLYGKMATNTNSSYKYPVIVDGVVMYMYKYESNKEAGFIAIGSAITSYRRNFTINARQQNYYGVENRGFIYADTDSIHCDLQPNEIKGINVHPTDFLCWKLESNWDYGLFVRQKTYVEHIVAEDLEPIDTPCYDIKCRGMPEKCKKLFLRSIDKAELTEQEIIDNKYNAEEVEYILDKKDITDFKVGLKVIGKLMPCHIDGGIVLVDTSYEMR